MCRSNLEVSSTLSLSIYDRDCTKNALYFPFNPRLLYIVELSLTALQIHSGSGATMIINNKIFSSEVCLSYPIRLTGKFAF